MKKQVVFLALFLMLTLQCLAQQHGNLGNAKGMKLAVLEPEGVGLSKDEQWMLSLIQSSITGDFNKYSGITIIDRQNLEAIIAEQKRSLAAMSSNEDAIRIGNLANASHVLSGKITKTPNAFMLELAITDVETGVRKASYSPRQVTPNALENLSALKDASADLLKQLGVNLTSSQLAEFRTPVSNNQIEAQTALAHGVVAQRQGTSVTALSYYYQAAAFDPSLLEAVKRSSVMSANISSANLGENIRNDIVWRRDWVERLKETEETFHRIISNANPPYTLFYSTGIETKDINYQTETANLSINMNLLSNREWFSAIQQALKAAQAVLDGLNTTNRKNDWGLAQWPFQSVSKTNPFASSKQYDISVEFELVNQQGRVIGRQTLNLRPYFSIGNGNNGRFTINFNENTISTLTFNAVKADDISDNLTIRPASVNGNPPETAGFPITATSEKKLQESLFLQIENGVVMGFSKSLSSREMMQHRNLVIPSEAWGRPVTSIGANAFENSELTNVTIPRSITSIGEKAFARNQLTSITISFGVRSIGANAFEKNKLKSLIITSSVTSIGAGAFAENELTNLTIPNSVRSIGANAFEKNKLKSLTIPNSVTSIGAEAFVENELTNLTIPNSLKTIGEDAFAYSYTTIYNGKGQNVIDHEFNKITEVTIGANVIFDQNIFYKSNNFMRVYTNYGYSAGTYIYTASGINMGWDKTDATKTYEEKDDELNTRHFSPSFTIGIPVMLNSIDTLFYKAGIQMSGSLEYFTPNTDFIRFGLNLAIGFYGIDKDAVREIHPDVDSLNPSILFNAGAFAKLYLAEQMYLSGGISFGHYGSYDGKNRSGDKIKGPGTSTVIFPVGVGLDFGSKDTGFILEAKYNIVPLENETVGYLLFNAGWKFGRKRMAN